MWVAWLDRSVADLLKAFWFDRSAAGYAALPDARANASPIPEAARSRR